MNKAQWHLTDCYQKLHLTKDLARYYTYNATNDWVKMKEQLARDKENEHQLKPEAPDELAPVKNPK